MSKVKTGKSSRICQGDIYKDVDFIEYAVEQKGVVEISKITFPHVIVLTQDCDLNQDYTVRWSRQGTSNHDKKLFSAIVAPMYNAEYVFKGQHLSELGLEMAEINQKATPGKNIAQNQTPRYHYLSFPEGIPLVPSIIDFKHYFTVNVEYLKSHKNNNFVCRLGNLYREDLSHRFSSFLSRIGLPEEKRKK